MSEDFASKLQQETVGCRLHLSSMGTRRALEREQVGTVAEQFRADEQRLSASKRLVDTKHAAWRAVKTVLSHAKVYWLARTVPYVEDGVRLLRREACVAFAQQVATFQTDLATAARELQAARGEMLAAAQAELGELYDPEDFPSDWASEFAIMHDFQELNPPAVLKQMSAEIYERECARVKAAFEQAVAVGEQAFANEMLEIVGRLRLRLEPDQEGKRKILHRTAIDGLHEFLERFRSLSIGSNEQLEQLTTRCRELTEGVTVEQLRDSGEQRAALVPALAEVEQTLAAMVEAQPSRRVRVRMQQPQEDVA